MANGNGGCRENVPNRKGKLRRMTEWRDANGNRIGRCPSSKLLGRLGNESYARMPARVDSEQVSTLDST